MQRIGIIAFLIIMTNCCMSLAASFPYTLNYQGMLTNKTGQSVNTPQTITFNLYTTPVGADLPFWTETLSNVLVSNGQLSVTLGTVTPLDPTKFSGDTYLGMKVGSQAEMLPRQKMTSVAYAFNAVNALNGIPQNGVIMWSGAVDQIPPGWALCDGTTGTPDLRDRFIVGVGTRFGSGKVRNVKGGEEDHVLAIDEMPSHTHTQNSHKHKVANNTSGGGGGNTVGETVTNAPPHGDANYWNFNVSANSMEATATNQNTGGELHMTISPLTTHLLLS